MTKKMMLRRLKLDQWGYDQWGTPWDKGQETRLWEYGPYLDLDAGQVGVINASTRNDAKRKIADNHPEPVRFYR